MIEKNFFNLLYLGNKHKHVARAPVYRSLQMQDILSNYNEKRTARKTTDIIKTLLGHGARASRISQPHTHVAINVLKPDGKKAIRLRMAK